MTDEEQRMMFRHLLILCLGHCLPAVLGANSSIDCHIGGTVTLPCDGPAATDTKEVHVLWLFGGSPACSYENGSRCETGHYVNRTWLGSIQQKNFSLVINPVRKEDAGAYECRINYVGEQTIRLFVKGDRKREDAETPPGGGRKRRDTGTAGEGSQDEVCRSYIEREDHSGTKDKQDSDENPAGASSVRNPVVTVGTVGTVGTVVIAAAALFTRRLWKWKRDKKQYVMRTSEDAPINDASVYVEGCS